MTPRDPCPRRPRSEADLPFRRRPMVRWFSPGELVRAGVKAVLSALFGAYADRRELLALQAEHATGRGGPLSEVLDLSDREDLWVDYLADLGDGFDATYTLARLLAEEELDIGGHRTSRGDVLVMGGDQVYPTATRDEYHDRLVGPYRAALPCEPDDPPLLLAIPGNHDWYDGLTSFMRLFCQRRWIGGWHTRQRRSYFAAKLPHDWWLWGLDVQLASDIDQPQLDFFGEIAAARDLMKPGSKIILCSAEPAWLYHRIKGPDEYENLAFFERKVVRPHGHRVVVGLAGDLHAYARWAEPGTGRQRFVSGGGGAYLYPTHHFPDELELPEADGGTSRFSLGGRPDRAASGDAPSDGRSALYPDRATSRRLSLGALALPFRNVSFSLLLGVFYLLFAWLTQSATKQPVAMGSNPGDPSSLLNALADTGSPWRVMSHFTAILKHTPEAAVLALVLVLGLIGFADARSRWVGVVQGTVHGAAHVFLAMGLMWGFAVLNLSLLGGLLPPGLDWGVESFWQIILFSVEMLLVGGLAGGGLFGLYLVLTNVLLSKGGVKGVHDNEVFSCQHIPGYKNFLRLRLGEDGGLTIFPVGIPRPARWTVDADETDPGRPWLTTHGDVEDLAELIEEPVEVEGGAGP